jgi:hypothetical protein
MFCPAYDYYYHIFVESLNISFIKGSYQITVSVIIINMMSIIICVMWYLWMKSPQTTHTGWPYLIHNSAV